VQNTFAALAKEKKKPAPQPVAQAPAIKEDLTRVVKNWADDSDEEDGFEVVKVHKKKKDNKKVPSIKNISNLLPKDSLKAKENKSTTAAPASGNGEVHVDGRKAESEEQADEDQEEEEEDDDDEEEESSEEERQEEEENPTEEARVEVPEPLSQKPAPSTKLSKKEQKKAEARELDDLLNGLVIEAAASAPSPAPLATPIVANDDNAESAKDEGASSSKKKKSKKKASSSAAGGAAAAPSPQPVVEAPPKPVVVKKAAAPSAVERAALEAKERAEKAAKDKKKSKAKANFDY